MQFGGEIKQERTTDVLEHFLHLLLASLAVNGHPQHHILKQGTHKRIENKNQTKSVTGTGIKLKNRNRSGNIYWNWNPIRPRERKREEGRKNIGTWHSIASEAMRAR